MACNLDYETFEEQVRLFEIICHAHWREYKRTGRKRGLEIIGLRMFNKLRVTEIDRIKVRIENERRKLKQRDSIASSSIAGTTQKAPASRSMQVLAD